MGVSDALRPQHRLAAPHTDRARRQPTGRNSIHMITDELKRQFGELAVEFSENLERGAHANLEALADQWLALEVKVGRVVCNDEVLSWFSKPIFEQPVTLH
jgi:hypothetical protein